MTALSAAPGGELYAGTEARGVFRLKNGRVVERFTFAGTAGGLRSDTVNAVFVDREGVVWFGTPRGVCRYDPRGVRVEQLSRETESNFIRTLYRTPAGRLLAGTSRGLFARDDAGAGAWREVEEVAGKTVYAVAEDSRGLLLVGTNAGLFVGVQEGPEGSKRVRRALAPEREGEGRGGVGQEAGRGGGEKPRSRREGAVENERTAAEEGKPRTGEG